MNKNADNNNQNRRLNRPNLVRTNCNMNGDTADRCFELVGYPAGFKKRTNSNQNTTNALISEKSGSGCIPANVAGGTLRILSSPKSLSYTHKLIDILVTGFLNLTKELISYARSKNEVVIGPATVSGIQVGAFKVVIGPSTVNVPFYYSFCVTLEPYLMYAGAILQARIDTVVWGSPNKLLDADGSWVRITAFRDIEQSSNIILDKHVYRSCGSQLEV
ncbi:hypothetical protein CTI12_AA314700 [Artemisia annua]|uniref:Uncharacterized protein n=1 Tax=Artemisia annua TaxID=35608 RepID=A0A2U1N2K8_ARTAN|nr:hypothetical protein CTI12_AA314700 [Artemisia annua]